MKAIDDLENKNSTGHDGISKKLSKSIRNELCKSLTLITKSNVNKRYIS